MSIRHSLRNRFLVLLALFLANTGCMGLQFRTAPVQFENPFERFDITPVQPNDAEAAGITLRLLPPPGGLSKSREEMVMFMQIQNGQGKRIATVQTQTGRYGAGTGQDSYHLYSETVFEDGGGRLNSEMEVSNRGEILRWIGGAHQSRAGKFIIRDWKRTPVLPQEAVRPGASWQYEETMDMKLDSFWIKQLDSAPYQMKVTSTLTGFATVRGRRAAVIQSHAKKTELQHFKVWWMKIGLALEANLDELAYLDYESGQILAKIVTAQTKTVNDKTGATDDGVSQSVWYPLGE